MASSIAAEFLDRFGNTDAKVYSVATVLFTFASVLVFQWLWTFPRTSHFPFLGQNFGNVAQKQQYFLSNAQKVFHEGYANFKTSVWRTISTDGEILVLPIAAADEINKQPEDVVSRVVANDKTFETKLLGITFATPIMVHTVKADLTHNIPSLTGPLYHEVERAIHEVVGESTEWVEINIFQKLLQIVAIVAGLAFVGPTMYRHDDYLHNSIMFTVDLFQAVSKLKRYPNIGPLRWIASKFTLEVKKLAQHREKAFGFLLPLIKDRKAATQGKKPEEKPKDMLQWLIEKSTKFNNNDKDIAMVLILLNVAAIHTTTITVTHILYDLIGYCPEVIDELRAEIRTVRAAHNGMITSEALYKMKLLDSVMRESTRVNPTNVMRMQRVVLQPFKLADGTAIPAGVDIAVPALPVNLDPLKYPDPERFDPYRYVKLRSGENPDPNGYSSRELYQFISVTKENMAFGFGRPACPGRFFAATEIKLILTRLLENYDMKVPDGVRGRYANNVRGTSISPDATKTIMFRRRTDG